MFEPLEGSPNVGLFEHYSKKSPLTNIVAVEVYNGGSRKGEDERSQQLAERFNYGEIGGSDSHMVSLIGLCATRFDGDVRNVEDPDIVPHCVMFLDDAGVLHRH